jgi:hypothetical protein
MIGSVRNDADEERGVFGPFFVVSLASVRSAEANLRLS